ncbi:MAG: glycosyltransferase [Clostridia bacterium]|nr:glycosyltransferase [Clostridia bacterium]
MYKVCFVTTASITLKSFVLELADAMHKTGSFEIHFICDNDDEFKSLLPSYIHYHPVPMKRGISFDGIKVIGKLRRLFKQEKFDLVQYSTPNASCYASIAARVAKIPVRLYCQWGIVYVGFTGLKRFIFKTIEKMVCRNSTRIEPDSISNLNFSISEGLYTKEKGAVIWNGSACGVNLKKFDISKRDVFKAEIRQKYEIPQDALVYIFVGRIGRDKGINELLVAAEKMNELKDDTYLLLVGELENEQFLDKRLLNWSQNQKRVIYCGFTNEVEKYLAAADVYLLPSYREGFGTTVIEAESMGLATIVTDIPGPINAMLKNETGLVVPKADADALFKSMLYLYDNRDKIIKFAKCGAEFAATSFEQEELFRQIILDRENMLKSVSGTNG